eukprot:1136158-Pelagomonas_calceolata.AAC.1
MRLRGKGVPSPLDLCLNPLEQICIPVCAGGCPEVWGQEVGKLPAKSGSSGSCLPACLTSSNDWALHQERYSGTSNLAGRMESDQLSPHMSHSLHTWSPKRQAYLGSMPNKAPQTQVVANYSACLVSILAPLLPAKRIHGASALGYLFSLIDVGIPERCLLRVAGMDLPQCIKVMNG